MMSDADLLAMLQSLGGQLVRHADGEFWAVFDNEFQTVIDGMVESSGPALTARTVDVRELAKEVALTVGATQYRIKRIEPDGTGVTVLLLWI